MAPGTDIQVGAAGPAVVIERVFDAPRVLVWRAWTEPDHFMRWYGPAGMTTHRCEIDLRVGGRRFIGMQSSDGQEYYTTGLYLEILPLERFVATDAPSDAAGNPVPPSRYGMREGISLETIVTVTFEELDGGRTKMTLDQSGFPSKDWAAGAGGGWSQAFDKLVAILGDA